MRTDSIALEEKRLEEVSTLDSYTQFHERHRIFPTLFEDREHKKIIDLSAGVGVVAKRITEQYPAELTCNEVSPKCLSLLKEEGHNTTSFDLDNVEKPFPIKDKEMDAVISLATIEHLINIDFFVQEINRILKDNGYLYISAPNYNGIIYLAKLIINGKSFHDPMHPIERYEFLGHVRYFTYRTLKEFVESHGFTLEAVYLGVPKYGSAFLRLKEKSKIRAWFFKSIMIIMYKLGSPRWASEPVLCFRKSEISKNQKPRKVIL